MEVARSKTVQPHVLGGTMVTIETDISRGLHAFSIVGLAGKAVDEAKDRVSSAIKHSGFQSPKSKNQKIVVSLAPADLKKEGTHFDLPMAVGYLTAAGEVSPTSTTRAYIGELGLDGTLRPVRGVLNCVLAARAAGIDEIIVPQDNAAEAALIDDIVVYGAATLTDVLDHIAVEIDDTHLKPQPATSITDTWQHAGTRLEDVRGKRAPNEDSLSRQLVVTT